jgi:MFS family permease
MLSSSYNIPNTFWPIVAGIINDIYGYRITMIIFLINSLIGQSMLITCFNNIDTPSYLILGYIGRFMLGMSDSIEIPTFTLIT